MKKQMEKYGILLLCTLVLAAVLCFGMGRMEAEPFFFRLEGPWGQERIDVFEAEDGIQYVFLPSYGSMDRL